LHETACLNRLVRTGAARRINKDREIVYLRDVATWTR
jgi:hypothetical protein